MSGVAVRVGMRVDGGVRTGIGHVMRCLALAEELLARGLAVVLLGEVEVPWLREDLARRGLHPRPAPATPEALVAAALAVHLDAIVLDSYVLDPACSGALRDAGVVTLAVVDGDTRGQVADLYLDQNLDADLGWAGLPVGARALEGLRYVLIRDAVRGCRPPQPYARANPARPHVVCFFGGTDAYNAAPITLPLLLATERPLRATVIAARPELAEELAATPTGPDQSVQIMPPTPRLPELVATADVVISASGTSLWDLLCLGAPTALVWVVDNQRQGYDRVIARGLAAGLGRLDDLVRDVGAAKQATATLDELLARADLRAELSARAWSTVDGQGRARVADALLTLSTPI